MSASERTTLKLSRPFSPSVRDDRQITLDFFDVLLPCRKFEVEYKVTEPGAVSITAEFLLRLLHAVDGMDEQAIAAFFGFNEREMSFVMSEVASNDYVARTDGHAWLTRAGRALFTGGSESPHIFTVVQKSLSVGFDLIALAPQEFSLLTDFERKLNELPIADVSLVSSAASHIPSAFRRFFTEITLRTERDASRNLSLYSVDGVTPEKRFSATVPVYLRSHASHPGDPGPELDAWRTAQEVDDRARVVEALASYIEAMKTSARVDDGQAYSILTEVAPEFLSDFVRRDGLAVERFFNAAAARVGEFRSDRPTIPLLGTLFTPENNERLKDALDYATKLKVDKQRRIPGIVWLVPDVHWGHTRALPAVLGSIETMLGSSEGADDEVEEPEFRRVAITRGRPRLHMHAAFNQFEELGEYAPVPPTLEVLWIPGLVVAMLVHAPIRALRAVPVPLGILSFEPAVIEKVGRLLASHSQIAAGWITD